MKPIILSLFVLATAASAKEYPLGKKVLPHKLQAELAAAGYAKTQVSCFGDDCKVNLIDESSARLPAKAKAVVDAHDPTDTERIRIATLARKWKAGTITATEKDELLKVMVIQYFGIRD